MLHVPSDLSRVTSCDTLSVISAHRKRSRAGGEDRCISSVLAVYVLLRIRDFPRLMNVIEVH